VSQEYHQAGIKQFADSGVRLCSDYEFAVALENERDYKKGFIPGAI